MGRPVELTTSSLVLLALERVAWVAFAAARLRAWPAADAAACADELLEQYRRRFGDSS